jgi:hypothetical protein
VICSILIILIYPIFHQYHKHYKPLINIYMTHSLCIIQKINLLYFLYLLSFKFIKNKDINKLKIFKILIFTNNLISLSLSILYSFYIQLLFFHFLFNLMILIFLPIKNLLEPLIIRNSNNCLINC